MKNVLLNKIRLFIDSGYGSKTLFYIFLGVLIVPNVILSFTENLTLPGRIANILLPLGLYYVLITIFRRIGLTIWLMLPFMLFGAFQLVQLDMYGRSVLAVDMFLNVATTDTEEVGELLGSLKGIILLVILLYLPMLVAATIDLANKNKSYLLNRRWLKGQRIIGLSILGIGCIATAFCFRDNPNYSIKDDIYPVNVVNNLNTAIKREVRLSDYQQNVKNFHYGATATHPDSLREIYVLVIGETSRGNNWQLLGYSRPTNPLLSKRAKKGELITFNHAMSESNVTHKSVPMMLTPLAADRYSELYKTKSIITAFKEAGFKTAFFSNQPRNHSFIDFYGEEADTTLFIQEDDRFKVNNYTYDISLTQCLKEKVEKGDKKLLVVLHTYGSHFDYQDRYEANNRHFIPDKIEVAVRSNRRNIVNAYDNTIVATDQLLDKTIATLDSVPHAITAMIYAADHGEDLFDDSRHLFLHASPCPSVYQLYVPMIAYTGKDYNKAFPSVKPQLLKHRHSQVSTTENVFHTMLNIAGIYAPCYDKTNSLASTHYEERNRKYINDHNEAVDLKRAGFGPQDFKEMLRLKLTSYLP